MAAARRHLSLEAVTETLPVWRGQELAQPVGRILSSGHALLDAQLPGGGWPLDGMVELLQPQADSPFWQLVLPALARAVATSAGPVALVAPPRAPFVPCMAAQGVPGERLLWLRATRPALRLWAAEQALRCADVAAVLAWLPQARDADLRRLQLAAQDHSRLLFVFRDAGARHDGSPARLRLWLEPDPAGSSATPPMLQVHIVKRRGPPLQRPVPVRLRAAAVDALLAARQSQNTRQGPGPTTTPVRAPATLERAHALDRAAAA